MKRELRRALHFARMVPHDRRAYYWMITALLQATGPRRDGSVPFTLRRVK